MKKNLIFFLLLYTLNLSAAVDLNLENIATNNELIMWIALFSLGAIGILVLFLSSRQMSKLKKDIKNSEEDTEKTNQVESQILSDMSQNIQNLAQETIETAKKISTNDKSEVINSQLLKVVNSENELLSITTNLIEFLRIKSNKIKISNIDITLSNLLSDISEVIKINTKKVKSDFELIYNIENNISENLKGDTLNLNKIFVNLIFFNIQNSAKEVELKIYKDTIFKKERKISFSIKSDLKIDVSNSTNIFNSNYNEETKSYESLDLFIAKELSKLIGGELIAKNDKDGYLEFLLTISLEENEIEYCILKRYVKKILIIDSCEKSSQAIKKMLVYLKHKPKTLSIEDYLLNISSFSKYDIIIFDEKLLTDKISKIFLKYRMKVIYIKNLFDTNKKRFIDEIEIIKPLTRNQLSESIEIDFSKIQKNIDITDSPSTKKESKRTKVYKNSFIDTTNIDLNTFSVFRGTNILLVEDNFINQKLIISILSKSGINLTIANDGREALKILYTGKNFNLVLMDINMPIMDGYAATKYIRKNSNYDQLPIIALTALTSTFDIDKMFSSGMNGYLPKPLRKEKLFTVFTTFIDERAKDRRSKRREEKFIKKLDGLDIELGIAQSGSNETFYKEILSEFQDAYIKSDKVFKELVEDERVEQLKMFCIDIQGLSGSIGAEDLHNLVVEVIRKIIYKEFNLLPTYIELYSNELIKINKSIDKYLSAA